MTSLTRVALLVCAIFLTAVGSVHAFTVNSTANTSDAVVGNGECWTGAMVGAGKECTLRAAIQEVNAAAGGGTIDFSIASVTGAANLPVITKSVTIDGGAQGRAEIRGKFNGGDVTLVLTGSGNTVKKLVLGDGIRFEDGSGSLLEDCYVGTDPTSTIGRFGAGAQIKNSSGNTIRKNVLSGNLGVGVFITGATSTDNLVVGNMIGTDASGTIKVSNGANGSGVAITNASGNTIGGPDPADQNLISGTGTGVLIAGATASENRIEGNVIGLDAGGTFAIEELGGSGVMIASAPNNLVVNNVISGNNNYGVHVDTASDNRILGNLIGPAVDGVHDVPLFGPPARFQHIGVRLTDATDTVVGEPGAGNTISGNEFGVTIEGTSTGNRIRSNEIGPNVNGDPLGNDEQGVFVAGSGNLIGGLDAGSGNVIAYSGRNGVGVFVGTNNAIVGNTIFSNAELAIDLDFDDVTPNDDGDADNGANDRQNFPELAIVKGVPQGTLETTPGTYRIEFFKVDECDPSGYGEAQTLISAATVTVGASGIATFSAPAPDRGRFLTATATALVGGVPTSTSELSACAVATNTVPLKGVLVVDSVGDEPDATPGNGACATAANTCTLRAAIQEANILPKRQTVTFDIAGSGPFTIKPGPGGLPVIDRALVIDGTTQPGAGLTPVIELDGSNAGPDVDGLTLTDGKSVVKGLAINRFSRDGIALRGKGKDVVQGNFIGTDVTGTIARGNGRDGILVKESGKHLIGGPAINLGNVISGNLGHGIAVDIGGDGNVIIGNAIGTNAARTAAVGNAGNGIVLSFVAKNFIGAGADSANVISGNGAAGILLGREATKHRIAGNRIGTDDTGSAKIPNRVGILIEEGEKNEIGDAEAPNLVSGNTEGGIRLRAGARKNDVVSNRIGTDAEGTEPLGNGGPGVGIDGASDNLVQANVIADNDLGVGVSGSGAFENVIEANVIGTNADQDVDLGNKGFGVVFLNDAHDNVVGGKGKKDGNIIAGNGSAGGGGGVVVLGGVRNAIRANALLANEPLNVDLGGDGVTANDLGDADVGPNSLQNAPVLLDAKRADGALALHGTLNSTAKTKLVVDLFLSDVCPGAGGEGARYWRSFKLGTGDDGNVEFFSTSKEKNGPFGAFIAATVTDKVGNTSEISSCIAITGGP